MTPASPRTLSRTREILQDLEAARRRDGEVRVQRAVSDEEQRRDHRDLDVEQLAVDDPPILLDVEDFGEDAAQRSKEARREPDEADRAIELDRSARRDDIVDHSLNRRVRGLGVGRHQLVEQGIDLGRRRRCRLVEDRRHADDQQQ